MEPVGICLVVGGSIAVGAIGKKIYNHLTSIENEQERVERLERERLDNQHQKQLLREKEEHNQKMAIIFIERELMNKEINEKTENIQRLEQSLQKCPKADTK